MLLNDTEIKALAEQGMIQPFVPEKIRRVEHHWDGLHWFLKGREPIGAVQHSAVTHYLKVLSYGLGHYGYDLTLSLNDFREFVKVPGEIMDPKNFDEKFLTLNTCEVDESGYYFVLSGLNCGLGVANEKLKIPPDITVLFIGKSTYARLGIVPHVTPAEAGWEGHLTMEISNTSPNDCRIYANEGIVQALFFKGNPCATPYGDGKYQNQAAGVTLARV
jgi:dCTP deaminase